MREKQDRQHVNLSSSLKEGDGEEEKRKQAFQKADRFSMEASKQPFGRQTAACVQEGEFPPEKKSGKAQNVQESKPRFCLVSGGKKEIEEKGKATLF